MTNSERWLPVQGFERYEVSDKGRVRSLPREFPRCAGRVLKPGINHKGHHSVCLSNNGSTKQFRVHILVLEAFVGPRPKGLLGLHLDDDKANNNVENLYWGTYSDNAADAVRNGTHYPGSLTECKRGHVINGLSKNGARYCTECRRDAHRKWKIANPRPKAENPYGRRRLTEEHREMIRGDQRAARIVAADYSISHTAVLRIRRG